MDKTNSTTIDPSGEPEAAERPYLPPIDDAELARRNEAAIRLLDAWEDDAASEEDQRETMAVLRVALGEDRVASSRNLFP
jgi:hypothetical protein